MILVEIKIDSRQAGVNTDDQMRNMVELVESLVGKHFSQEMDRVDVTVTEYGPYDVYTRPLTIGITMDCFDVHQSAADEAHLGTDMARHRWIIRNAEAFQADWRGVWEKIADGNTTFNLWIKMLPSEGSAFLEGPIPIGSKGK